MQIGAEDLVVIADGPIRTLGQANRRPGQGGALGDAGMNLVAGDGGLRDGQSALDIAELFFLFQEVLAKLCFP